MGGLAAPADLERTRDLLRRDDWLAQVSDTFRDSLLRETVLRRFDRGAAIFRQGDAVDGLWALVEGGVAMEIAPGERGPSFAHQIRPGRWFGEMAILLGSERKVTCRTTRPSVCLLVPMRRLEQVLATQPDSWRWMSRLCAVNLARTIGAVDDLMIRESEPRLAAVLLRLAEARATDNSHEARPEIDASQEELAVMVNLSRSTLGRILKGLEDAGLVSCRYGRILILDQAGLRARIGP